MSTVETLQAKLTEKFADKIQQTNVAYNELTIEIANDHLRDIAIALRDDPTFQFNLLADVCGIDYLHYGISEWKTEVATATGFSRGVETQNNKKKKQDETSRFAAVYHLLSTVHNHRLRLRVFADGPNCIIPSVVDIWPSANWFEREAFDLFGILFQGHPDLRRILTDYGFVGHPFRKDFPLIGNVEVRYDAELKRVVYEPVSIEPRVLEPKVIRDDNRYQVE